MKSLVSTAHSILSEFVDIESQVVLFLDHDWSELPLVCKALRAAGGEEVAICLAVCVSRKAWAVGLAGKQKVRVNTARLALAVALAWNGDCAHVALRWHEFANLCSAAGVHFEATLKHTHTHTLKHTSRMRREETALVCVCVCVWKVLLSMISALHLIPEVLVQVWVRTF